MRFAYHRYLLAFSVLATACGGDDGQGVSSDPTVAPDAPPPSTVCRASVAIHLAAPVADARARAPMPIAIDLKDEGGMPGAHPMKIVLTKDGAPVATLSDEAREPGTIDLALDPAVTADLGIGRYAIDATAGCPSGATESVPADATTPLFLVRLGVTSLDVGDGDGARVELMYHAVDHAYDNVLPISRMTAATMAIPANEPEIDKADGTLRTFAAPWDDVASPPVDDSGVVITDGVTLPVSLRVGTSPDLVFGIGKSARGNTSTGLGDPGVPPVRIVVDGTPGVDSSIVKPGAKTTVRVGAPLATAVARLDAKIAWHFEAKDESGAWSEIPGAGSSATLRIYGVLGNAQGTTAPNLPWVAVVDDATRAIAAGAASGVTDATGVREALVKHIFEDMSLAYDRVQGASHYTDYVSDTFADGATFKLARFLGRDLGKIVNCSDCASILTTFSNMLGASLKYTIIQSDFSLHPILGIGAKDFGSPFVSGRFAFTYHAVTSPDGAVTIDDATLAVDGDNDPAHAPYTKMLVQSMPGSEYLFRLSGDSHAEYTYVDKTTSLDF